MDALAGIEGAVEAAGNLKLLEEGGGACGHVIFVDRAGRDQRLVGVAEGGRRKDAVDVRLGAVGRLGEGDFAGMRELGALGGEAANTQPGQAVFALTGHKEAGEEVHVFQHDGVAVGNPLGPILAAGRGYRRRDQAEVASAVVGADEPEAVAVVDGVLVLVFARTDEGEGALGFGGRQHPGFGGGVAGRFQHQELAVAGAACAQVEALVVVLVDQLVLGVGRAEGVAPKLVLALLLFVLDGVEEGQIVHPIDEDLSMGTPVVRGPHDGAYALDLAWKGFAGDQVLDVQGVLAEAGGVGRVSQPTAIVRDVCCADGEEGVALGQLVAVKNHLLRRVLTCIGGAMGAAVDCVLQPLFGAGVVPPAAVVEGNRNVGLLYVREHFPVEVFTEAAERGHHGLCVGVFGFEVRGDLGVLLVAQPGVVVGEDRAMQKGLSVFFACDGRQDRRVLDHFLPSVVQRQLLASSLAFPGDAESNPNSRFGCGQLRARS